MTIAESETEAASSARLGARLRSAREEVGMTQAQAAVELGVSRPLLIAMEKGSREVNPLELVRLAQLYGRQVNELLRPSAPPEMVGARFRTALASAPGSAHLEESIAQLERGADDYLDLLRRSDSGLPGIYPAVRSIEHLEPESAGESLATDERNRLGIGDGPIDRLREAMELEVGIRVFMVSLPPKIAGLFVFIESLGGCVAINATHPVERRRWTMAHEYAHFLAARTKPEITLLSSGKRSNETERFADAFAENFLMPRTGLVRRFSELKRSKAGSVTPASLVQLAHSYCVSVQAMTLRLEGLGLVRPGTWDRLSEYRFQPRMAAEQLGLPIKSAPPERLPVHYRNLAIQLFSDGEITEGQLARYLHTDIVGARICFQGLTATRDVAEDGSLQILDLMDLAE